MVCFVRFYPLKVTIYIVMLNTYSLLTSSNDLFLEEIEHLCFHTAKLKTVKRFYGIHYHLWIQLVSFFSSREPSATELVPTPRVLLNSALSLNRRKIYQRATFNEFYRKFYHSFDPVLPLTTPSLALFYLLSSRM